MYYIFSKLRVKRTLDKVTYLREYELKDDFKIYL